MAESIKIKTMAEPKVILTEEQILQAISAFEEVSRVLNSLNESFIRPEDISSLIKENKDAWDVVSKAWHEQIIEKESSETKS